MFSFNFAEAISGIMESHKWSCGSEYSQSFEFYSSESGVTLYKQ